MEPPSKRLKLRQAPYESDDEEANQDELSMTPSQFNARQDPMYQLDKGRAKAATRLKSIFESIFEKYERDFTGVGDEIDLRTGEIIVDNGHLQSLEDEQEREREGSISSDEEERILRGKETRPAKRPHSTSLMPANPSSYNRTQSLQPWKQPAALGGSAHRLSSLAFPPTAFGDPSQFPFGLSMFGNSPVDPAWQVPELPSPSPHSMFGFGYNPQAPGFPQSLPFDMGSFMATGANHHGFNDGLFRQQGFRKLASAKSFTRASLPTSESRESDTDEDDILLARDREGASAPAVTRAVEKRLTLAAFVQGSTQGNRELQGALVTAQNPRKKSRNPRRQPKKTPIAEEHDESQPRILNEISAQGARRGNETSTPTKQTKAQPLRSGSGRSKKTSTSTTLQRSNDIHPARTTKSVERETTSISDQKLEIPRRKPGRPRKLAVAEDIKNLQKETEKNTQLETCTKSSPRTTAAASKPANYSAITISLPVRPSQHIKAPQELPAHAIQNGIKATEEDPFDPQQRRSSRARKQTEFYGSLKWPKRGERPSENTAEEINQDSSPSQTDRNTSLRSFVDCPDTSSAEQVQSEQGDVCGQATVDNEVVLELHGTTQTTDQRDDEDDTDPDMNDDEFEIGQIACSLSEERNTGNENEDSELALHSLTLEPSLLERSDMNNNEPSLQTDETFSRNELDPSYSFSDDEQELVRKPVDLAEDTQLAQQEQNTPSKGTSVLGNTDIFLNRQVASEDATRSRMSAISEPSETAQTDSELDFGSLDTNRTFDVPENSDEASPSSALAAEFNIPQQEPECQQELVMCEDQLSPSERTIPKQVRSPPLSPELDQQRSEGGSGSVSRLSPDLGGNSPNVEFSVGEDPEADQAESSNPPEVRLEAIPRTHTSAPVTPKKPRRSETEKNGTPSSRLTASPAKRFALASLVPDDPKGGNDGDEDELSIISSSSYYTPRSFRAKLARARRYSSSSSYYSSTPRKLSSRRHGLLVGGVGIGVFTPDRSPLGPLGRHVAPATDSDSRAVPRVKRGDGKNSISDPAQSSPLARTAAQNLLRTPRHGPRGSPTGMMTGTTGTTEDTGTLTLVRTPGGTMRKCGEDGFVCDRDFCFTCCK
ncbi:hypothetical protein F5X99DRAFT_383590 [Biscogniauxia marginata]|nr:hypothetical protein F5X99DRAFT_383590 [Biscogniauxia marginata]